MCRPMRPIRQRIALYRLGFAPCLWQPLLQCPVFLSQPASPTLINRGSDDVPSNAPNSSAYRVVEPRSGALCMRAGLGVRRIFKKTCRTSTDPPDF